MKFSNGTNLHLHFRPIHPPNYAEHLLTQPGLQMSCQFLDSSYLFSPPLQIFSLLKFLLGAALSNRLRSFDFTGGKDAISLSDRI